MMKATNISLIRESPSKEVSLYFRILRTLLHGSATLLGDPLEVLNSYPFADDRCEAFCPFEKSDQFNEGIDYADRDLTFR